MNIGDWVLTNHSDFPFIPVKITDIFGKDLPGHHAGTIYKIDRHIPPISYSIGYKDYGIWHEKFLVETTKIIQYLCNKYIK